MGISLQEGISRSCLIIQDGKKEAARPWEAGRAMGEEIGKKEEDLWARWK